MDMSYFAYCYKEVMTSEKMDKLFGGPPRAMEGPLTQREMDIAASIQEVTEEVMLGAARYAHELTGLSNLVIGRWRCFELRRERKNPPRGSVREPVDPAGPPGTPVVRSGRRSSFGISS